ncbi:carbohydrate esterase family 16 protein [Sphaerobolus stellatus SS14]|nr:carbohydrate esterase family 16 protein [Sphaerobolus stellatus SS14]
MVAVFAVLLSLSSLVFASYRSRLVADPLPHPIGRNDNNDGIHLAIGPRCGSLNGSFADVNAGLPDLHAFDTIVSFGDSYTDTGGNRDGTPPPPAVLIPPNAEAGGRSSNGYMWVEDLAYDYNITVMNYAISAAVTNRTLWPSRANNSDFVHQEALFLSQNHTLDPEKTLYVVFFGINDFLASQVDGDNLPEAAQSLLNLMDVLIQGTTKARNFLVLDVYGIGQEAPDGDAYKQQIFSGLNDRRNAKMFPPFRVAFVDFAPMWNDIINNQSPGYQAFGYTSNGYCQFGPCCDPGNICDDPEHTFYWIASHPAKEGQRVMANYVEDVLQQCKEQ